MSVEICIFVLSYRIREYEIKIYSNDKICEIQKLKDVNEIKITKHYNKTH